MSKATERRIQVRSALPNDVPLIISLIRELAEYERLSSTVCVTEPMLAGALFGASRAAEAILGCWDGEAVGFALFFPNFSTFLGRSGLYLEDLFVRPAARGRGIGRAMLQHLAGLCGQRGYGRMEWAVLDWNEPAIEFYKGLGASPLNDWSMFRLAGSALAKLGEKA